MRNLESLPLAPPWHLWYLDRLDSLCHLQHHNWDFMHLVQPQWQEPQDLRQHQLCKWLCLWQHQWVQSLQCPWHLGGLSLKFRRGDTGPLQLT